MALYFEDLQVGATEDGPEFTADKAAMMQYGVTNDPYPIHIDEDFARQSQFGGIIAPFGYTMSLFLRSMHGLRMNRDLQDAFLGAMEWRVKFAGPVRPGNRLHDRMTIVDKRLSSRGDRGVLDGPARRRQSEW
jgi:acyl dehydratase